MASSNKSEKLGLSLWEATDRPERLDFLKDNQILESKLGEHLANEFLHLTPEEKAGLGQSYWLDVSAGTGTTSRSVYLPTAPKFILTICTTCPPTMPREDGRLDMYWDYWYIGDDNKTTYSLGGTVFNAADTKILLYSRMSPNNSNLVMRMNESGKKYITLMLPRLS